MAQSTSWRPQPPSVTDPEAGEADLDYMGEEREDSGIQTEGQGEDSGIDWEKRAKDAFRFSTTYVDGNYRKQWEDSIRAFNNQHSSDSKYNSELYRKRSNLYRPKTRSIIRKNEAAAASAFFSNLDLISISAQNETDKVERASAEVMQQLLQYRLTKSIPWFQFLMGGIQDAQVQGAACAHIYWEFFEKYDGNVVTAKKDAPCCHLFPIENLRIDPSANWVDPVNTSPYLIELIPMYWCDVKSRMEHPDPKGRRWKKYSQATVFGRTPNPDDSTRQARYIAQQDPSQQKRDISDYDIVWIHRHIHRNDGTDVEFYTLASEKMLTDPEPLTNTVWHGMRPYVMGSVMLETHRAIPNSLPTVVKGLQEETNDLANQRQDNVKFVLNKGYRVKRGKNVDVSALVRNVPGRIIMCDDTEKDIFEEQWQDITASAYQEQDRLDADFNDLAGNFSPMQVNTARTPRESTHTMKMLQAPSNLLTEYMLKTYVETFVQPVLRQVMMLEQYYESDSVVMSLAGQKAGISQKYGMGEVSDELLNRELTLRVNVGMGATDPVMKLQRFIQACMSFAQIARLQPPGIDLKEVAKEMFGLSGYQDGARFIVDGQDPQVVQLMRQNQKLMQMLQKAGIQIKDKHESNVVKLESAKLGAATKLAVEKMKHGDKDKDRQHQSRHLLAQYIMDVNKGESDAERAKETAEQQHEFSMEEAKAAPKPNAA